MKDQARERLIFALDVDEFEEAERWVKLLHDRVGVFKVGKQLFTRCGPEVVHMVRGEGADVFLDLKYHDIPNTVAMSGVEAARLGVRMFNLHALGGRQMMERAVAELDRRWPKGSPERPLLLAVTILTSATSETLHEVGIDQPVEELVPRLARLAQQAGLDGVVASPKEVEAIRAVCGRDFAVVTPGVRPSFAALDDQKRVTTPAEAIAAGADYLVIGRPISAATDPVAAAEKILEEIAGALERH
ncbi:MAG TPA: orotidine-5'-phosphate decarboxylase [Desulfuromonadales bacterium]|nr:orotidine-5'-phosphate decarboxylase [Desulfuromonadales bacterium]